MANIYMLNEINNRAPLVSSNKLEDLPFNQYPSSQIELENQLACLKHDLNIALSLGIQLNTKNSLLIKNNKSFLERVCQLEDEVRELKNQITHKDISFTKVKNKITIKLEKIQAYQSKIKELEMKYLLAQKDLSEIDSLR
ncbi:hypothetical protein GLOIN_2v1778052 [Rhizophagus clarus]|uniref:Uncharacterized protein n=1 Tax=Rhizophagus clarus TaxID=94130 RepID=A0A8H3QTA3_9GLOM|nr:hypothetical protein GLOIN_2v1778052 [Rhizophagus clarus]